MTFDARDPKAWVWFAPVVTMFAAFPGVRSASVPFAVVILALLTFASWRRRTLADPVEAPLSLALAPVVVALAAHVDATRMLEQLGLSGIHVSSGEHFTGPCLMGFWVLLALTMGAGRKLAEAAAARHGLLVRALAWLATALACVAVALAVRRADRPTPSAYPASLPVLGALDAPEEDAARGTRVERVLGPVRVTRAPVHEDGRGCRVWIASAASSAQPPDNPMAWAFLSFSERCGRVLVRSDDARHAWFVESEGGRVTAFDQIEAKWAQPPPLKRFAGALRPPNAHLALAAVGVVAALASLLLRRSELPRDDNAYREGFVQADGTIAFGIDVPPLAGPPPAPMPMGPVVAIFGRGDESFREHAGPVVVRLLRGTLAEHRRAALAGPAFAFACATIAVTPLAVALLHFG